MNSIERVDSVFNFREPDKLPIHHIGFSSQVASALLGRDAHVGGGIQQWREAVAWWRGEDAHREFVERSFQDAIDVALVADNDIVRPTYWRLNRKPTRRIDEYTFLYEYGPESNWKVLKYDPNTEQSRHIDYIEPGEQTFADLEKQLDIEEEALDVYQPKDADYDFELRAQKLIGQERVIRVGGIGLMLPQEAIWLEATLDRPDLVHRFFRLAAERAAKTIPFLAGHGFRYIFGGGDLASQNGPLYSPKSFRELLLPYLQQVSDVCHRHGCLHMFSSDGNTWPLVDDLFGRSGIDVYFEIDRRAGMDLLKLRQRLPKLRMIGNISSHTVFTGTPQEISDEARACLDEARQARGVVVGASNYFVTGTPIKNVMALLDAIRMYR